MRGLNGIAAVAAMGVGFAFAPDAPRGQFMHRDIISIPAPPKPLTKRQRRRLRGKQKELRP
jgi:hypothetical protein